MWPERAPLKKVKFSLASKTILITFAISATGGGEFTMRIEDGMMRQIAEDLGLNARYEKGFTISVKNCWHFMTDGSAVGILFRDGEDFRYGMNLIFLMHLRYKAIVLAFTLMDTHIHFVLYGNYDECNRMMHEYYRRTAQYLAKKYDIHNLSDGDPLQYQAVDDDRYLKTAICYVLKNAPVAGLPYNAWDYPWSSGPLYFRSTGLWNVPGPESCVESKLFSTRQLDVIFHGGNNPCEHNRLMHRIKMCGNLVYPEEYVASEVVEKVFRTHKSYNYFLCRSREDEVDSRGGVTSYLTIPIQEMRMHKHDLCRSMFGVESVKTLNTGQRLQLARMLRSKFNCSKKQIARVCGLVYCEVEKLL